MLASSVRKSVSSRIFQPSDETLLALNYRLAPESRFPEPLLDVVYGYFRLVESLKIDPSNIVSTRLSKESQTAHHILCS